MYESCFIDDGQNRDGYAEGVPGLHGPIGFQFRPALPEERYQFLKGNDSDGKAQVKRVAGMLDKHLVSWDARNGKGDSVSKSADTIARLHPNLLAKVLDQVLGYSAAEAASDAKN